MKTIFLSIIFFFLLTSSAQADGWLFRRYSHPSPQRSVVVKKTVDHVEPKKNYFLLLDKEIEKAIIAKKDKGNKDYCLMCAP